MTDDATGPLMKSYVWYKDRVFFVSTINRESSAMYNPAIYAETMVWECDPKDLKRDAILHQDEAPRGSIHSHIEVCIRIATTGNPERPKEPTDD